MPRELRKRGKKKKASKLEDQPQAAHDDYPTSTGEPSWIKSAPPVDETPPDAPFGYVDPDVKAYFRTVDEQIRTWQDNQSPADDANEDLDPNEAKRLFFVASLNEMSGKEKQLATDPDCSVILERMAHSMDDFVRRVFLDSFSGSFEILLRHRFASHVCQTFFSLAVATISRETRGILPDITISEDKGELRTLTQLVLDICEELRPNFTSLIMDPFASHVLRSLLLLLCPTVRPEIHAAQGFVRSKKSMSWKAKQGTMKSVFSDDKGKDKEVSKASVPNQFSDAAAEFLRILREELNDNEVRALAANKVASPLLQLVLEIEADQGYTSTPGSLMDHVLVGMITAYHEDPGATPEASDYIVTLLRDPTSSHLLETLVSRCPGQIFNLLWSTYLQGKLARLALHPVANFVVAKACERLDSQQLVETLGELQSSWEKIIKSSRTGVLRTLIDRSCALGAHEKDVCEAIFTAFGLLDSEQRVKLVPCVLALKPLLEYTEMLTSEQPPQDAEHKSGRKTETEDLREPKVQGALILQSLLRLPEPHCSIVVDSISSLSVEELIAVSHNATSSRVLDVLLESPTVSFKAKRRLVTSLIGHYHTLVDDKIGSRIGDRCWMFADPYLREKIARSLIPYEQFLAASFYGKFFARNLNLYLLQRKPEEWKTLQANSKTSAPTTQPTLVPTPSQPSLQVGSGQGQAVPAPTETQKSKSSKKRREREDEIDALFNMALGSKIKKAAVAPAASHEARNVSDKQLTDVLGAIRAAPGGEHGHAKKKRKQ